MDISSQDRDFAVRTVLGEVDPGASDAERAAVASVILNRARSGQYGKSISNVVLSPGQFEPWATRRRELQGYSAKSPEYQRAGEIFDAVSSGAMADRTGGATHFYSPGAQRALGRAAPSWSREYPTAGQIGGHQFFYGPGSQQAGAGASDDLLGSWLAATSKGAPAAPAATPEAAPASGDNLLGSWSDAVTKPEAQPEAPPAVRTDASGRQRIVITPAGTPEPAPTNTEDQDVDLARSFAEHQGENFTDLAARLGIGALRGVKDVADTAAQGIAATGRLGAGALSGLGIVSPETASGVTDWASGVNARIAAEQAAWEQASAGNPSATIGRVAGQFATTAPALRGAAAALRGAAALMPAVPAAVRTVLAGAGYGGGAAALTSAASDEPLAQQVGEGAIGGALLAPVGAGAGALAGGARRILFGAIDPQTAQLASAARNVHGIPVTAGQISANPMVRFADSVLQRMPFTGYGARTVAQQTGLNRAIANEMGVAADKVTPDVVRQAKSTAYVPYDVAKSLMGPLHLDQQFFSDLSNVQASAHYNLEPKLAELIDKHLDNVASKINTASRTLDPDLYQALTRKNGPLDIAINSRDSKIATHAQGIKDALENLVGRNDPHLKQLKDEADYKYFVAKAIEPLANEAATGDISPAKLLRAVDYSHRDIGQLGHIGQRFLKELPSSGTSERLFAMQLAKAVLGGSLGLGGAAWFDPEHFQRDAALTGLAFLAGRGGSAFLRSKGLADALIQSGLGTTRPANRLMTALPRAAPAVALTHRALRGLPAPGSNAQ